MAEEKFSDNLLRAIAAELHFLSGMTAAREMFGKSYFSLGIGEKGAVDQAVFGMVAANFQTLTAESLAGRSSILASMPRTAPKSRPGHLFSGARSLDPIKVCCTSSRGEVPLCLTPISSSATPTASSTCSTSNAPNAPARAAITSIS
jgi:hypothetical protein